MSIRIIKAGFSTTIQDSGRTGNRANGVPVSGAMDMDSFRFANLLCGNDIDLPVLEITLNGLECLFTEETLIACCGNGSRMYIDNVPAPMGRALLLTPGSLLSFRPASHGCRAYLAIAGGFCAREDLGSCSTYPTASFGGLSGLALHNGDLLLCNSPRISPLSMAIRQSIRRDGNGFHAAKWGLANIIHRDETAHHVKIIPGPEWDWFDVTVRDSLFAETFSVSNRSNRMGYRLTGQLSGHAIKREMVSTAVCQGTIQVTHDGNLVLLMADAQTTGGYPRIGQVAHVDLPACAQLRPGQEVRFLPIGLMEASSELIKKERELFLVAEAIALLHHM